MSTPIGRKIKSIPARRIPGHRLETPESAAHDAESPDMRLQSLAARGTAVGNAPRGPFKILTIPQCWYDSLHADHGAGHGPDDGPGDDTGKGK